MHIQLRFFASVREALGTSSESIDLPASILTVGDVRTFLCERGGIWAETLSTQRSLRMAYEQVMTDPSTPITEDCEVAFFPPVTGG